MGRRKAGNGVAAAVASNAKKGTRAAKKSTTAAGPSIKLTVEDRRWYENVMLKRELIQREAQVKLESVEKDANDLARTISVREGVDVSGYDLDWKALTGMPKPPEDIPPAAPKEAVPEGENQTEA